MFFDDNAGLKFEGEDERIENNDEEDGIKVL